jgi:hypothetical protein
MGAGMAGSSSSGSSLGGAGGGVDSGIIRKRDTDTDL